MESIRIQYSNRFNSQVLLFNWVSRSSGGKEDPLLDKGEEAPPPSLKEMVKEVLKTPGAAETPPAAPGSWKSAVDRKFDRNRQKSPQSVKIRENVNSEIRAVFLAHSDFQNIREVQRKFHQKQFEQSR